MPKKVKKPSIATARWSRCIISQNKTPLVCSKENMIVWVNVLFAWRGAGATIRSDSDAKFVTENVHFFRAVSDFRIADKDLQTCIEIHKKCPV